MFKMKPVKDLQKIHSLVGRETTITCSILSNGNLRIDGSVNGDIKVEGDVYIGDSALIIGNITAKSITIGGVVEGNITAAGILKLLSTAKLNGDVNVSGFVADSGGIFIGKCHMVNPPQKVLEALFTRKRDKETSIDWLAVNK